MDRQQRATRPVSEESTPDTPFEAEPESSLLHEARGWAGSARDARARMEVDRAAEVLQTQRRNGPGQ
jgi:hypothetical protein